MMKLNVEPQTALCDSKVAIVLSDLPPFGRVCIRAEMKLPWAPNVSFMSEAVFTVNEQGIVDLSKQKPDSGSYDFIDSMGLISSMRIASGKFDEVGQNISVDCPLFINLTAQCGEQKSSAQLKRLFFSPEVKYQPITEPFTGAFFYTENSNFPVILMLGGSGGDLCANLPIASLLASHGFNVLTVAYFKGKGLPSQLSKIPLEYFERVFAWLKSHPLTQNKPLYLHCTSKGGELGLLLASKYPVFKKVAAFAPHAYIFQGVNFKNHSTWTYGGKELPYIRLKNRDVFSHMLNCFLKNKPFGFTSVYKKGLQTAKNKEDCRIKVENINADLLLFAGQQDDIWNAYDGCTEIMDTLRKKNDAHRYKYYNYENAGHPFYAPYIIPAAENSMKIAPRMTFSSGGTLQGNAEALSDSWEKMLAFFKE